MIAQNPFQECYLNTKLEMGRCGKSFHFAVLNIVLFVAVGFFFFLFFNTLAGRL